MLQTQIARLVLIPMALVAVDQALAQGVKVDETAFLDQTAESLYRRHRGQKTVRERTFAAIPNTERGKYRALVLHAIETLKASPLFERRFRD
jgi:hypothetical protein